MLKRIKAIFGKIFSRKKKAAKKEDSSIYPMF